MRLVVETMAFLRIPSEEILTLPDLLEARFPYNNTLIYNRVQLFLSRQRELASLEPTIGEPDQKTQEDEISFYWYSGFIPESTAIASNLKSDGKSHWVIVAPQCETGHELDFVAVSFSIIVNWAEDNCFNGIEEKLYLPLKELCPQDPLNETLTVFHPVYWMSKETALNLDTEVPNNQMSLRELRPEEVWLVLRNWKYGTAEKGGLLLAGILRLGSAGLEVKGRLVSWGVCLPDGSIHAVYTVPEERGRGYAKLVVQFLSKTLAGRGFVPVAQVDVTNAISRALFVSVGYKFSHKMGWITAKGRGEPNSVLTQSGTGEESVPSQGLSEHQFHDEN